MPIIIRIEERGLSCNRLPLVQRVISTNDLDIAKRRAISNALSLGYRCPRIVSITSEVYNGA